MNRERPKPTAPAVPAGLLNEGVPKLLELERGLSSNPVEAYLRDVQPFLLRSELVLPGLHAG